MDNYLLKSHGNNNLLIGDFNDQFINDIYDNINDLDYVDNEQEIINQHDYASNMEKVKRLNQQEILMLMISKMQIIKKTLKSIKITLKILSLSKVITQKKILKLKILQF